MRRAMLALTIVVGAVDAVPALARDYPYCIKGCDYGSGLGDCSFATYQQCQATASGRLAYCGANPYFSRNADPLPNRSSRRHY